jgi:hypothetical protein
MTNNKQQTAVDSIIELCQELLANHYSISHDGVCSEIIKFCQEQAKEMEKKQIILSIAKNLPIEDGVLTAVQKAEQYYNKTYGGDQQ